jgi:hypothetical protein
MPVSGYGEAARSRAARPFYCSAVSFLIPACHGSALASENVGRDSLLWRDRLASGFDVRCGRHGICSLTSPAVLSAETGSGQAHLNSVGAAASPTIHSARRSTRGTGRAVAAGTW